MSVGDNIKRIRIEKGLTQKQLGELCGMADSAIRRYENGGANPKYETLKKIADGLDVSVSILRDDYSAFKTSVINSSPLLRATQDESEGWLFQDVLQRKIIQNLDMTQDKQMLIIDYNKLNAIGKEEARKRVNELTEIPKYRKDAPD